MVTGKNRKSDSPGIKVLTYKHVLIKLSGADWSECFLCVNGLLSPTRREGTPVKITLPLANPTCLAAQNTRLNQPGSRLERTRPEGRAGRLGRGWPVHCSSTGSTVS